MKENLEFISEVLKGKRTDVITKEEKYMLEAIVASLESKDPSTQVGACIVSEDGNILSLGCNNPPEGWDEDKFPYARDVEKYGEEQTKYPYIIHAEINALASYLGPKKDLKNATAYVTLFPCPHCASTLTQFGIKKIVYASDKYHDTKEALESRTLLKNCGIETVSIKDIIDKKLKGINISLEEETPRVTIEREKQKIKLNITPRKP